MDTINLNDFGNLGDLAKQMQDTYAGGMSAMNTAGEAVAEDINPDHYIELNIKLSAKVEGHEYLVDSKVTFDIELNPVLNSETGDLSVALDELGIDLGTDKNAVMEQLGKPRIVGVVKSINTKELKISNEDGPIEVELNKKGTLLATLEDNKLLCNCESVFSFPNNTNVFVAIPSMEKMQENMIIDLDKLGEETDFSWEEKDKDNLKVDGNIKIEKY